MKHVMVIGREGGGVIGMVGGNQLMYYDIITAFVSRSNSLYKVLETNTIFGN